MGLDAWLHWLARILILVGLVHVLVRRIVPFTVFRLRMGDAEIAPPEPGTRLFEVGRRCNCLTSLRVLPRRHGAAAFTAGLLKPRIYVSELLVEVLDDRELEALLLHELQHCRSRDPARALVVTTLVDLVWWLPLARALERRVMTKIEFAADDAGARVGRGSLASAILKVARFHVAPPAPSGAVSFVPGAGVAVRVRRLLGDSEYPSKWPLDQSRIRATFVVLCGLWALGLTAYGTHHAHQPHADSAIEDGQVEDD